MTSMPTTFSAQIALQHRSDLRASAAADRQIRPARRSSNRWQRFPKNLGSASPSVPSLSIGHRSPEPV